MLIRSFVLNPKCVSLADSIQCCMPLNHSARSASSSFSSTSRLWTSPADSGVYPQSSLRSTLARGSRSLTARLVHSLLLLLLQDDLFLPLSLSLSGFMGRCPSRDETEPRSTSDAALAPGPSSNSDVEPRDSSAPSDKLKYSLSASPFSYILSSSSSSSLSALGPFFCSSLTSRSVCIFSACSTYTPSKSRLPLAKQSPTEVVTASAPY